jgi:hypothetical protein
MPISQATILAIYGDLCDIVEKVETLANQATQLELFPDVSSREEALRLTAVNLFASAKEAQRQAIAHMMADDSEIVANPITGRLDE